MAPKGENRFAYDVARDYDRGRSLPAEVLEECCRGIVEATGLRPGAMVLDAGAGTGVLAGSLVWQDYRYLGIDASPEMLRRFGWKSVDIVQGDLRRVPLVDGCIDLVVAFRVFGVVRGWRHAIRECVRALKPEAHLVAGRVARNSGSLADFIRVERNQLLREAGIATDRPGANDGEVELELSHTMEQTAGIGNVDFIVETTPRQLLDQNLSGWRISELDDGVRDRLRSRLAEIVKGRTGGLDVAVEQPAALQLDVYRRR
jgi:SAM-dependent methyltransferase